jgi:hypothetical protein
MKRSQFVVAGLALTSALSLAACARPGTNPTQVRYVAAEGETPAAPTVPPEPTTPPEQPELAGEETPDAQSEPIPEPTVAKTQKWVKIFSGASDEDITPPKNIRSGSKTVELNTAENAVIGTYVTDGAGRTLYRFDEDSAKPPKATCNGDCAEAWPPLLIKSPGKIAKDAKPGDILGQGVKGTWFAVDPKGGKTGKLPESAGGTGGADDSDDSGKSGGDAGDDAPVDPGY